MASRKNEKERRRVERVAAERAEADAARRKRLVTGAAAAAFAAVIVVVALVVISQSGGEDEGGEPAAVPEVVSAIDGLPQSGTRLGDPRAEVTISEFADLQCPACAQYAETVVPDLVEGPVAAGEASLDFRNFTILGPESITAAEAALAAGEQDRLWQFVETFYARQGGEGSGYVTDEFLTEVATDAGVPDIDQWEQDRTDPRWGEQIAAGERDAIDAGFQGTPSILVEGPGGSEPLGTVGSLAEIEAAIDRVR
jgi:protein-disulfide isomerase